MKMKKQLLLMLIAMGTATAFAQSTLNVHQKSGGAVSYAFSEKPVVTYSGDNLVLKTAKVEVEYPLGNLEKLTFGTAEADAINQVTTELPSERVTHIYDMGGALVKSVDVSLPLSTDGLKPGVYVIKNGKSTYKIIKK